MTREQLAEKIKEIARENTGAELAEASVLFCSVAPHDRSGNVSSIAPMPFFILQV